MMNRIGNSIYALIGLASAIITIVPFAVSDTVRLWVRNHSNWLYGALVLLVVAVTILLGYAKDLNRKYREIDASRKRASDHDTGMLHEVLTQIPPDGTIMTWLKTGFFVKRIPFANARAVEKLCQKLNMNPFGFDNTQVNDAYETLKAAIEDFDDEVTRSTIFEDKNYEENGNYENVHVPLPKTREQEESYYATLKEIKDSVKRLTSAYDNFLKTCSANGLNIYSSDAG